MSYQRLIALVLVTSTLNSIADDSGQWSLLYEFHFTYKLYCKQYFYAQSRTSGKPNYFIHELKHGGKMGSQTAVGGWGSPYPNTFTYSFGDKHYFYGQASRSKYWFIQELISNGKVGKELSNGRFNNYFHAMFPFAIDGRQFYYGQRKNGNVYFTQELLPDATLGKNELASGKWDRYYDVQFAFSINGTHYFYGQCKKDKQYTITQLKSGGTIGSETDHGTLDDYDHSQFPFVYAGKQYIYRKSEKGSNIAEISSDGKMQPQQHRDDLDHHYKFSYVIDDVVYFYGQDPDKKWAITTFVMK